jgi:hypothetical protein
MGIVSRSRRRPIRQALNRRQDADVEAARTGRVSAREQTSHNWMIPAAPPAAAWPSAHCRRFARQRRKSLFVM